MSKALSQEEIDVLLEDRNQMSDSDTLNIEALESTTPSARGRRANSYNFKRPRLFSQDQMRVLSHVHESFARDLAGFLSAQLRTIVDIRLTSVDQVIYSEYVMASAPPSALYVVEAVDLNQKVVFELDPRLVVFTIEKLFGGPGSFLGKTREVSQIEQRVMSKVMNRAYRELEKSWRQVNGLSLREETFESNAEFVQIIPGVEPAFVCTFEVTVYDNRSFINICYPYLLLERIIGRTGMNQWISSSSSDVPPAVRRRYESNVRSLNVQLRAELGRTRLSLKEIMRLETGDVVLLKGRINEPVCVLVGDHEKYVASLGRSGRRRALRILGRTQSNPETNGNEH